MTINKRVVGWFESGHASEALLGGHPYFIPDLTYRDRHDRLLILRQLVGWAEANNDPSTAVEPFMGALSTAAADEDVESVYDLVWCLILMSNGLDFAIPVSHSEVREQLDLADSISEAPGAETAGVRRRVRSALAD